MKSNDLKPEVTIQDLIEFHRRGADNCEAYSRTDDPDKQTEKHYAKRSTWHQQAVDFLRGCASTGYTAVDMTTAAAQGFRGGVASVVMDLPKLYSVSDSECDDRCAHFNRGVLACHDAIIAAGGKVAE